MNDMQTIFEETIADQRADDPLARYVELEHRRREIEAELQRIKTEETEIEGRILDEWADRGQQNANVNGMTVYVSQDFYCSKRAGVDTAVICDRLKTIGLTAIVGENYNASSLKSWVKEQLTSGGEIPNELSMLLNYDTVPRLRTRLTS